MKKEHPGRTQGHDLIFKAGSVREENPRTRATTAWNAVRSPAGPGVPGDADVEGIMAGYKTAF
jgi:hypothetical protein